ncbi:uncharacterized protein BT62DRAFT_931335 [Guyanagaster necrorhizus]|uniref:Uncharacterized protein n=1 Tax=Guyanagaster necrorhizus TaxID=856835 RepID=A0A9P7VUL8_9AGAR|nr:uncharacterized protein BT62DRAFT_931335 [Guyanagaster necrorhizus MCA 3950]KAG7446760.1 hypothetical protein BT62DRAFT_931335 [Guyanagaster necrorhizus MCA 3950]
MSSIRQPLLLSRMIESHILCNVTCTGDSMLQTYSNGIADIDSVIVLGTSAEMTPVFGHYYPTLWS